MDVVREAGQLVPQHLPGQALEFWTGVCGGVSNVIVDSLDPRSNYLLNTGIAGVEEADLVLLIGAIPKV